MRLNAGNFGVNRIGWPAAAGLALMLLMAAALSRGPAIEVGSPFSSPSAAEVESNYGQLPLAFEPNAGRLNGRIDFTTHTAAGSVALTGGAAVLAPDAGHPIGLHLAGGADAEPTAMERLPGVVNDLRGSDPKSWETNLPTFERVRYPEVYPGIAIDWYGNAQTLEYDFRVAAGADPEQIVVRVAGARDLRVAGNGDLVIDSGRESIRQAAPVAYQPGDSGRRPIDAEYHLDGGRVAFQLGDFDPARRLVIDPVLLDYSTYLGGAVSVGIPSDRGLGIAVDANGSAYIGGETNNSDFNTTVGAFDTTQNSNSTDLFVAKLGLSGGLVYSTYLGGDNTDQLKDVAVDADGSAYVTGFTNSVSGFVTTAGAHDSTIDGLDAIVIKLSPDGSALEYATLLGGNGNDTGNGISVDASEDVFIAGETMSTDFCVALDCSVEADADGAVNDAFVAKLTPDEAAAPGDSDVVYSTYLGGGLVDKALGIDIDPLGAAYVVGETASTDFDTTPGVVDGNDGVNDAFAFKLNPAGGLSYSTYLSGGQTDSASDVAVDGDGSAYVTGFAGTTFETTPGAHQAAIAGGPADRDAFVTVLDPTATSREYATYFGGAGDESSVPQIAVGSSGAITIAGSTASTTPSFPLVESLQPDAGGDDIYVTQLIPDGLAAPADSDIVYSTFLGGGAAEALGGLALDSKGDPYVTGDTLSTDFCLGAACSIEPDSGDTAEDAIVAKLDLGPDLSADLTDAPDPVAPGGNVTYTVAVDNTVNPFLATGVTLRVNLTDAAIYQDGLSDPRCVPGPGFLSDVLCDLGTVAGGDPATNVTVVATAPTQGGITTSVEVSSDQDDLAVLNNFDTEVTDITESADLDVSVSDSADPVLPGADLSYLVNVDNLGPSNSAATVTLALPAGVSYRDAASTPACSSGAPGQVVCPLAPLDAPGPGVDSTIAVTAPNTPGELSALAEVFPFDPDPVSTNDTDIETTTVSAPSDGGGGGDGGGDAGGGGAGDVADTTPPDTTITKRPPKRTFKRVAGFEFTSTEPGSRFECALDKRDFVACATPFSLKRLKFGKHILRVRAIDAAGNIDATPATKTWTVKRMPRRKR